MRGLILKDFYLLSKYCRMILFFIIFFTVYAIIAPENLFFQIYQAILVGVTPMTLYSYDEREHWCTYSQTLPVSKRQYVTAKYAIGLLCVLAFIVFETAVQFVSRGMTAGLLWKDYLTGALLLLTFGLISQAIILPFLFKFGAEKGRMIYILTIVVLSAAIGTFMELQKIQFTNVQETSIAAVVCLLILALYILSWFLSVRFYEKREI